MSPKKVSVKKKFTRNVPRKNMKDAIALDVRLVDGRRRGVEGRTWTRCGSLVMSYTQHHLRHRVWQTVWWCCEWGPGYMPDCPSGCHR